MKKIFIFLSTIFIFCNSAGSSPAEKGPLFVQVHYSSPHDSLALNELKALLSGKTFTVTEKNRKREKVTVYADKNISSLLKKKYPTLETVTADFRRECRSGNRKTAGNRTFVGLSDSRGLAPCFKTLAIENRLPWGKRERDYSLTHTDNYPFMSEGAEPWQSDRHLVLVQTGVTAMTRAFIRAVENAGSLDYTVSETRKITGSADIAVTSNEVSFLEPCRYPLRNRMLFCSPLKYFDILKISGFDVIELTGNHNNDYGRTHNLNTIKLIEDHQMIYFGGGRNIDDAEKVKYIERKGTRFAFIGFNQWGPAGAWATSKGPGAARLRKKTFIRNINEARGNADIVVVSVQWGNENNPLPHREQVSYFHLASELGADIMLSSSAHRAMGIEFYQGRFISYGLGNFLFDQMQTVNHRRGVITRHHFYRKKHIETELIPYMIYNYSQPSLLGREKAEPLWRYIFRYSRGPVFR
jgi:hypothetical protein